MSVSKTELARQILCEVMPAGGVSSSRTYAEYLRDLACIAAGGVPPAAEACCRNTKNELLQAWYCAVAGWGVLDRNPGAGFAYSLRELSYAWAGQPVVEVRRSGDDALSDFTMDGVLDGTLAAWVTAGGGAEHGYVRTWYDQSGNARDLLQTTDALQPQIVDAGAVITSGPQPAIEFDGVDDGLATAAFAYSTTHVSLFHVMAPLNAAAGIRCFLRQRPNGAVGTEPGWIWSGNVALFKGTLSEDTAGNSVGSSVAGQGVITIDRHIHSILIQPSQWLCYRNDSLYQTLNTTKGGTPPTVTIAATQALWVGENFDSDDRPFEGKMQEVIGYYSDQAPARSAAVDEINTYYSAF
jgi:hypothetical protein